MSAPAQSIHWITVHRVTRGPLRIAQPRTGMPWIWRLSRPGGIYYRVSTSHSFVRSPGHDAFLLILPDKGNAASTVPWREKKKKDDSWKSIRS